MPLRVSTFYSLYLYFLAAEARAHLLPAVPRRILASDEKLMGSDEQD